MYCSKDNLRTGLMRRAIKDLASFFALSQSCFNSKATRLESSSRLFLLALVSASNSFKSSGS